jgi:hypothetical protein
MVNEEVLDEVKTVSVFYYTEANISVKQVTVLQRQISIMETGYHKITVFSVPHYLQNHAVLSVA